MDPRTDVDVVQRAVCFHCGETVKDGGVVLEEKAFCCQGCKLVYEILEEHKLCQYYAIQESPGNSPSAGRGEKFAYLDDPQVVKLLTRFSDGSTATTSLRIPGMHCSSCIWLLENLYRIDSGILQSRTDFLKKEIRIRYAEGKTDLRRIAELLTSLGYQPEINLDSIEKKPEKEPNRHLYYKIGIAGFCFANIMLLSFPEYLSSHDVDPNLRNTFAWLNLALALPVFFYCSAEYFRSSIAGLSKRVINLDVPLALGIAILFFRSVVEIVGGTGPGFMDSLAGLVFFLLLGKLFQAKTYDALNFDRDYRSYFPLAVTTRRNGIETTVPVSRLAVGDKIVVRNNDIIPADAFLLHGDAHIDYSFVTGEFTPVSRGVGEMIYAGGRQVGNAIELEVFNAVSQSYLTQLWNDNQPEHQGRWQVTTLSNAISKYFTAGILTFAAAAAVLWLPDDPARALSAVTGVLIVACPCALALSTPFALGTVLRIFGRRKFYLKNISVVESLANIHSIVFDKTGTVTQSRRSAVRFVGNDLSRRERTIIASLARNSTHPLSRSVFEAMAGGEILDTVEFLEVPNAGLSGRIDDVPVRLGSRSFVGQPDRHTTENRAGDHVEGETRVHVSINDIVRGYFSIANRYRDGLNRLIASLGRRYDLILLSGDNDAERAHLESRFNGKINLHFGQSPSDKLSFISSLQREKKRILMVGDGLNDAGALRQSDVGIALTEDIAAFSPACDAILDGTALSQLDGFLRLCRASMRIVIASFVISFLYNIAGLSFAMRGALSPVAAAVLMPLSSITVVLFTTISVRLVARRLGIAFVPYTVAA